jgi:hypothetical protein
LGTDCGLGLAVVFFFGAGFQDLEKAIVVKLRWWLGVNWATLFDFIAIFNNNETPKKKK